MSIVLLAMVFSRKMVSRVSRFVSVFSTSTVQEALHLASLFHFDRDGETAVCQW